MARTQESLGEQEASRANLNATETTRDVSHAERLDETITETIEILKEDRTDAVWNFTQWTSFADGKESKSRLISDLEEHINAISFLQVTQSEPARLESVNAATEPEAVRTSDESTGKAEMAGTAKIREELRQMSCLDSYWYWRVLAGVHNPRTRELFPEVVLQTAGLRHGVDTQERSVNARSQLD